MHNKRSKEKHQVTQKNKSDRIKAHLFSTETGKAKKAWSDDPEPTNITASPDSTHQRDRWTYTRSHRDKQTTLDQERRNTTKTSEQ